MENPTNTAPHTSSSDLPEPVTPARGRRRTLKLNEETVRPYTPPQLIAWGTLLDLTQGPRGFLADGASGGSRAI